MNKINSLDFSKAFNYKATALQSLKTKKLMSLDENRSLIVKNLGFIEDTIAYASQIHSSNIKWVEHPGCIHNCDGLLTQNNIPLMIQTADCVPAFLFDVENRITGLIHSGWRGTYKKIIPKAVNKILNRGSKIENVKIFLGAAIQGCCYEVKGDFIEKFNLEAIIKKNNKFYFSNVKQIELDLLNIGLNDNQLLICNKCTYENKNLCSFRRDGNLSGRMFSIIKGNYN